MKFLNWGRVKATLNIFRRREDKATAIVPSTAVAGITGNKHESFTLPDRIVRIKAKNAWEKRRNAKWKLPNNTKVGDFVLFPFCAHRYVTRSGTVVAIRGQRAKIRMTCKTGVQDRGWCVIYRKISPPPA